MEPTGSTGDSSGTGRGSSRRRILAAVAAGTLGTAGRVAGRKGSPPGRSDSQSLAGVDERSAGGLDERAQPAGTWPLFQHDAQNTGHARNVRGPTRTAGARWGYLDGESFQTTPVVTGDAVFAADAGADEVIAVDRSDGRERWRVETPVGDGRMTFADGTLFVPGDRLEARSPADGSVEWTVNVGDPTSVVVVGNFAYVAAGTGVYRIDRRTQSVDWHVDRITQLQPGLVVTEDYVYAAGTQYGRVIALDPPTGGRRWLRRLEGSTYGVPTAADNRVVVSTDAQLVGKGYESGLTKWTYDATVRSSVAVADGVVYATDEGEDVFALDLRSGEEQWRMAVLPGSNPPVLAGDTLYVTGTDGSVAALSPTDGSVDWQASVGGARASNVAVAGGELYVGDRDGQLVALADGASGGLRTATATSGDVATPEPTGTDGSSDTAVAATATPTDGSAPGFGVLTGAVAAGLGAAAAFRRLNGRDDGAE